MSTKLKFKVGDFVTLDPNSGYKYGWTVDTTKKVEPGEGGIGIIYKKERNQILWLIVPKVYYPYEPRQDRTWGDDQIMPYEGRS